LIKKRRIVVGRLHIRMAARAEHPRPRGRQRARAELYERPPQLDCHWRSLRYRSCWHRMRAAFLTDLPWFNPLGDRSPCGGVACSRMRCIHTKEYVKIDRFEFTSRLHSFVDKVMHSRKG
jgi:hypothetical protein